MVSSTVSLLSEASLESVPAVEPTLANQAAQYFQEMFKKVGEIPVSTWIVLFVLAALAIVLLVLRGKQGKLSSRMIAHAALAIALSFLLSHIRLYRMPQGGSITVASMLPLMLFSYAFGMTPGLVAGMAYGVLEFFQDPVMLPVAPVYALCQVALDYILGFGCIGLAAAFKEKNKMDATHLSYGIALASVLRFGCSVLSGVLFFAEYAGDQNPWIYSSIYNGSYMLPEMIICLAVGIAIGPRLCKAMRRNM